MIPSTRPKAKGRSPPPSTGCPTYEMAVEPPRRTPPRLSSPPVQQQQQTRRNSLSSPARRMMALSSPPSEQQRCNSMSECCSSATSTPTSSSPSTWNNNTVTTKNNSNRRHSSRTLNICSRFAYYLPRRRQRLAWFCNIWIAILTVTYLHLALRYKDDQQKEEIMKHAIIQKSILPSTLLLAGNNKNDTQTRDSQPINAAAEEQTIWRELYVRGSTAGNTDNNKIRHHPRVFPSSPLSELYPEETKKNFFFENEMGVLKPPPSSKKVRRRPSYKPQCEPKAEWHSYNYMNCNAFHEIDFVAGLTKEETSLEYQFRGGTRETWLVGASRTSAPQQQQRVILKTLRWIKNYDEIRFNHQRIDALALERLTKSPHIVETYGFCGMSALNEFAEVGHFGRYFATMHANITSRELLAYARDTALGLADVHEIDGSNTVATLVHHDFSPKNLLLSTDNKIKLSDFNDGQLLRWDFAKNQRCKGFDWDNLCGTTVERTNRRSPEECAGPRKRYGTTERTEVYHLGTIFHFMLSKEQFPYQFEERTLNGTLYQPDPKVVKQLILNGVQPPLPPEIEESKDPAIQAIIRAMRKAFTFDAKERPSAREIAKLLDESTFNDTRNVNDKSPDLDEPSRPLNLSKTDTNSRVGGSKQDRRDLYDLQQDGDQPDAASKQSVEGNKRTSVFALDDENLKSFDPYSSVGAF